MRRNGKMLVAGLVSLGMMISFAGCGVVVNESGTSEKNSSVASGSTENSSSQSAVSSESGSQEASKGEEISKEETLSGELRLQVFANETGVHESAWNAVTAAFEEATGVKVTLMMGSQVNKQNSAAWLAGEVPADIIWCNGGEIAYDAMVAGNVFYDLTDILMDGMIYGTEDKISDKLNTDVIQLRDGHMFYAPLLNSTSGVWYDTELVKEVPRNFEAFMKVSEEFAGQGIAGMTYTGVHSDYCINMLLLPAIAACGQEFYDRVMACEPEAFKDERFKAVLERFKEYCDAGYLLKGSVAMDHTSSQLEWLNHKAAFIPNGLWLETEMHDYIPENFHMGFCASPLIADDQKPTLILSANNVAVAAESDNLENALAFIRYIYRDEVQLEFMSKYGYLSALNTISPSEAEMTEVTKNVCEYAYGNDVQFVAKKQNLKDLVVAEFKTIVNDLASGGISVDDACKRLADVAGQ